jgi:hypothetical protein
LVVVLVVVSQMGLPHLAALVGAVLMVKLFLRQVAQERQDKVMQEEMGLTI